MWKYYQDRYSFAVKKFLCGLHEKFFNIIDKPPKRKNNELTSNYVLRMEKRHALRELNRTILQLRVFDLNSVNAILNSEIPEKSKRIYKIMKEQTEHYNLCVYLRGEIRGR